jgi:hypothetical protein
MNKAQLKGLYDSSGLGFPEEFLAEVLKPTGKKGAIINDDLIRANCTLSEIRRRNIDITSLHKYEDLRKVLPQSVLYRLRYNEHCLAYRIDELKESAQKDVRENPDWVYTTKINGVRATLVIDNTGLHLFARDVDPVDCSLIDYADIVFLPFYHRDALKASIALDVELFFDNNASMEDLAVLLALGADTTLSPSLLCGSLLSLSAPMAIQLQNEYYNRLGKTLLSIYILHPLFYKGVNYFGAPIAEGKKVLLQILQELQAAGLPAKTVNHSNKTAPEKQAFLEATIQAGFEGVVAHKLSAPFLPGRAKDSWVKIKTTSLVNLADTIEGFVTGYKADDKLVTHLELSCYREKDGQTFLHRVASVPVNKKQQIMFTELVGTTPTLKPEIYNMIVEVAGSHFNSAGYLVSPSFVRFRGDKTATDCKVTEAWIDRYTRVNNNIR